MKDTLELVKIETLTGIDVYRDPASLDAIIEGIRATISAMTFDVSTEAGRDLIRSTAHKITRSKTALDKLGKEIELHKHKAANLERERLFYQKQAEEKAKQILEDQIKADAAREADRANRERVKQEIVDDLCGRPLLVQSAVDIALAIMAGKIRNVKVVY